MKKKLAVFLSALMIVTSSSGYVFSGNSEVTTVSAATVSNHHMTAINTGSGMMISWRFPASDDENSVYKLYADGELIYTSDAGMATSYLHKDGTSSTSYTLETLNGSQVVSSEKCNYNSNTDYLQINLDVPQAQTSGVTYSPNDCSIGDADGDGENEIFVKWDPSNSKDNSQKGYTDKVFIDCYKLDGTKLWRIDLGINIRAGAHYTQMLVADFDNDGYAELTCKTADGTVDGVGNVIGDASADHRNSSGYILSGNEYYTLFDGRTGAALDTVDYNPQRGTVKNWGDSYGNRVDRFLGAVMYLDTDHPSAVTVRGYYTRMTACAYDVVDKKLVQRWYFDTGNSSSAVGYGDGNHNCMPADVDGDGRQELVLGGTCLDDDGTVLWNTNAGHGDAIHVGKFLPDRDGLQVWTCHEVSPYGASLLDAGTGEVIFRKTESSDTGRCCADNIWAGNDGGEFWYGNDVFDSEGNTVGSRSGIGINFLAYWDGDLEREVLDDTTIKKYTGSGSSTLVTFTGCASNNSTKATPCLSGDILGDWREEVILRTEDNTALRIFCTPYETDYRITCLLDDVQYRTQVLGENIAYNQPPHASFYLGSDQPLPDHSGDSGIVTPAATAAYLTDGAVYTIKNVHSGMYLTAESGTSMANISQSSADAPNEYNTWRAIYAGNGYYYLYSQTADKLSYCLDVTAKSADNGTNIELYNSKLGDAQMFKFTLNDDGSYKILTKVSSDKSCVEVVDALTDEGANIQEWELNGADCQDWILTQVTDSGAVMDTTKIYMIKNAETGLYMEVEGGTKEAGTNVQQWGADDSSSHNSWTLGNAGNGYYYIYSQLGDGKTYYLDVTDGKSASGTNIEIWTENLTSSQLFKFVANPDGTYHILTKASKDNCAIEVESGNTSSGANVIQASVSSAVYQDWFLIEVGEITVETDTPETNIMIGDVNGDGKISVIDVVVMKRYMLGIITEDDLVFANADTDGDLSIKALDFVQVKKLVLGV